MQCQTAIQETGTVSLWLFVFLSGLKHSPCRTRHSIVAELLEVVCRFGVSLLIHSDQGCNFVSAVFTEMCQLLGIQKTRTKAYHPQSDGMVERFNRTIEDQLAKFVDYHQQDWDEELPYLMLAYCSAVHEPTGCASANVMFRRDLCLPVDLLLSRPDEEVWRAADNYAEDLCAKLSGFITLLEIISKWHHRVVIPRNLYYGSKGWMTTKFFLFTHFWRESDWCNWWYH